MPPQMPVMPPEQFWLMLAQTIATAFLGIGAISVAVVSAIIAYRNNFGWAPVVFPTWHRYSIGAVGHLSEVVFGFETWNRRKYPVVIRLVSVTFSGTPLLESPTIDGHVPMDSPDDAGTDTHRFSQSQTVGPQTSTEFTITAPLEVDDIHSLGGAITVEVTYYDPKTNKRTKITAKTTYGMAMSTPEREDHVKAMVA